MRPVLRSAAPRTLLVVAAVAATVLLGPGPTTAAPSVATAAPVASVVRVEPRPDHTGSPRADILLTAAPPLLHCTIRPGVHGCVSFAPPPGPSLVVAVLYAESHFRGARVVVHLETGPSGCTPRVSDDEGGGDLLGPLAVLQGTVRSVETFERCDVRLHGAFLDTGDDAADATWVHQDPTLADVQVVAFSVS